MTAGHREAPNPALGVVRAGFWMEVTSNSVLKENESTWALSRDGAELRTEFTGRGGRAYSNFPFSLS